MGRPVVESQHVTASLSQATRGVLATAAAVVAQRPDGRVDVSAMVAEHEGVLKLLGYLELSLGLRTAVRSKLGPDATELCSEDAAARSRAIGNVRAEMDREQRRARRRERDAARPSAEQKAERRRAEQLREAQDKVGAAERRVETYRAEARELRAERDELAGRLEELQNELEEARARARKDRELATDIGKVAGNLAALLASEATRLVARQSDPHRSPGAADAVEERLSAAAGAAGLPESLCARTLTWLRVLLAEFADPTPPRVTAGEELKLTVDVLGGGTDIGGSCVLISAGGTRILVDAGIRPGGTDAAGMAPKNIGRALTESLDAVIVTHAHNDHGGWVPAVLARQPHCPVYVTAQTRDLLARMWHDSAKVMRSRAGTDGTAPYDLDDVRHAIDMMEPLRFGSQRRIGVLAAELFPAGHILGAAGVVIRAGDRRVVVSGDVSASGQKTVGGIQIPESAVGADLFLLESTYAGITRHVPRAQAVDDFVRMISETVERGGRVLVPAFALGRAQEIAMIVGEYLPEVDVLVDGLARDICDIYDEYPGPDGRQLSTIGNRIRKVPRRRAGTEIESERLRSGVVITTSGMLSGGPAITWAQRILPDRRSALLLVGYQDEDSPGRRLLDLATAGGGRFELDLPDGSSTDIEVAATVSQYQLGAHAVANELVDIVTEVGPSEVMLVHGLKVNQRSFASRLELRRQATASCEMPWRPILGGTE